LSEKVQINNFNQTEMGGIIEQLESAKMVDLSLDILASLFARFNKGKSIR